MSKEEMLLAEGISYSMDDLETHLNNHLLVVGASGTGKTRGIVTPAILRPSGSLLISDPKGNLHDRYKGWLEAKGYEVRKLDFTDPAHSDRWDPICYVHGETDAVKMAHNIVTAGGSVGTKHMDPFWDESSEMLLTALILYQMEIRGKRREKFNQPGPTFPALNTLIRAGRRGTEFAAGKSLLDTIMKDHPENSAARRIYDTVAVSPDRTWDSILITAAAKLRSIDTKDMRQMMSGDDLQIASLGTKKKAVFVIVSDTDRSMDYLGNIFFTAAMQELCREADKNGGRLKVPVRFILDDFATNCKIAEFPRMISSIRSRGISAALLIQSFSQLQQGYGEDWRTICGNCDTMVYLGGSDVNTAEDIAVRLDRPLRDILYMPVGDAWIFRRGSRPAYGKVINPDRMPEMEEVR